MVRQVKLNRISENYKTKSGLQIMHETYTLFHI